MDLIQMTRDLGEAIQKSDNYTAFVVAKAALDGDEILQGKIGEFNLKKISLSEAVQGGKKSQSEIDALEAEVHALYDGIVANPAMMAYTATRDELDHMLQFMQQIIISSANGEDPQTIEEADACGGDCGGCAGCH